MTKPTPRERAALGLAVALAVAAIPPGLAGARTMAELPDLTQELPSRISIVTVGDAHRLVFRSSARNRGPGELILRGHRRSVRVPHMSVDQRIDLIDPVSGELRGQLTRPRVGTMRFVETETHHHWHLADFERYELRSAADHWVVRDRKTGFCVGNRYTWSRRARHIMRHRYDRYCAISRPGALSVLTGLSPWWADDYKPHLEGQFIDVTTLPAGRYVLVHRANPEARLREASLRNNAASVLLTVERIGPAPPSVRVLARCAGRERCPG